MICKAIRGTQDILPFEVELWNFVETLAKNIFGLYGFHEIRTPIIEDIHLFIRSLGEATDIVEKQMFVIERKDSRIVLRPEGTAGVVRAFCENNLYNTDPIKKYFYIGPMFRGERPQKGRLRQFYHIGVENLSADSPFSDVEVLLMLWKLLGRLGLKEVKIKLNSIGCQQDRDKFRGFLKEALKDKVKFLCQDCQRRYERNVFRLLDCKNPSCREVVSGVVDGDGFLCDQCQEHFSFIVEKLNSYGVGFILDKFLVRGLDYYNRTVFEVVHPGLGKGQDALAAGGRYDYLVSQISAGKIDSPAVGFAIGIERLLIAMDKEGLVDGFLEGQNLVDVVVVYQDRKFQNHAFNLVAKLRDLGIAVVMDFSGKSMKAQMRWANKVGARFVVILGEKEVAGAEISLKDMHNGTQFSVSELELGKSLLKLIKDS